MTVTDAAWLVPEREVVRLLALTPRRADQLRRLGLLRSLAQPEPYRFREVVSLRVAKGLLDRGLTVRQVRKAVHDLRRLRPGTESPLAELRVTARDGEILVEQGDQLVEPSGQVVMTFSGRGLEEAVRESARRGLVRPLRGPAGESGEAERWFELASTWDGDPAEWERAVDAYQRVIALSPTHGAAWSNLGLLLHRMGRYEDAGRHYRMALTVDPTLAEAAYNLGSLQEDLGDAPQALVWYRRALEIQPTYADAHFNLASVLERTGQRGSARVHWEAYLALDPESHWGEIARAWLEGGGEGVP